MSYPTLCQIWFVLMGVLLGGYAVLDGFDLGVGILYPFVTGNDAERRAVLNTIGPIWDGNEVWLVTFGGAMFAMFPLAYKSIFSGFYTAFMLLLFMLISRAVSMEFRSKMHRASWRTFWDWCFFVGSTGATLLFGVAVGNALRGVFVDQAGNIPGGLFTQLHPYCLLVGLLAVAMFAMHGSIYLHLKTTGELHRRIEATVWKCYLAFIALFVAVTIYSLFEIPRATDNIAAHPWLWIVPVLNILAIANIPRTLRQRRALASFVSSCCAILAFVFLLGVALFPNMVASTSPDNNLSIYNAASSAKTLTIGLIIVAVGMPCVLSYTTVIYWTFRGREELGTEKY